MLDKDSSIGELAVMLHSLREDFSRMETKLDEAINKSNEDRRALGERVTRLEEQNKTLFAANNNLRKMAYATIGTAVASGCGAAIAILIGS